MTTVAWLLLGAAIGFVLQSSRFCFAAAISDYILFRGTNGLRFIGGFLLITIPGFALVQYLTVSGGGVLPGKIVPISLGVLLGGLLFGLGMVLAGGCFASSLVRLGEGAGSYALTIVGAVIGIWLVGASGPLQGLAILADGLAVTAVDSISTAPNGGFHLPSLLSGFLPGQVAPWIVGPILSLLVVTAVYLLLALIARRSV